MDPLKKKGPVEAVQTRLAQARRAPVGTAQGSFLHGIAPEFIRCGRCSERNRRPSWAWIDLRRRKVHPNTLSDDPTNDLPGTYLFWMVSLHPSQI